MGADVIGWRACPLQRKLGEDGFLAKQKLRVQRAAAREAAAGRDPATFIVRLNILGRGVRETTLKAMNDALGDFERGIPECQTCPISAGKVVGCYSYLTYPIDEEAERALFRFVVESANGPESPQREAVRELITMLDMLPSEALIIDRGDEPGKFAARSEPLRASIVWDGDTREIESTAILNAFRLSVEEPEDVAAYGRAFREFVAWRVRSSVRASRSLDELERFCDLVTRTADYARGKPAKILVDA